MSTARTNAMSDRWRTGLAAAIATAVFVGEEWWRGHGFRAVHVDEAVLVGVIAGAVIWWRARRRHTGD